MKCGSQPTLNLSADCPRLDLNTPYPAPVPAGQSVSVGILPILNTKP